MRFVEKFKARRLGVKISNLGLISPESVLHIEPHSRLSNVKIKLPPLGQPLSIGAYSYIREGSEINFLKAIGRYCSIGRGVVLGQARDNHPIHWVATSMSLSKGYVARDDFATIGHDVWIAHDAVVMAGVSIGTGAVIGRNAVVTHDVEPYQIVAGNPAKVIRSRFTEQQIKELLQSHWWDFDYAEVGKLPFDDVDRFLEMVPTLSKAAAYQTILISNRKVSGV